MTEKVVLRSKLLCQLDALDAVQRRACRLDHLGELHEFSLGYAHSVSSTNAVESALTLFRYGDEIRQRFDVEALIADLRAHERASKVLRQWFGPAKWNQLETAVRDDVARINEWAMRAFRDVLAVSQAIHIVDALCASRSPDRWNFGLPELVGQHPDLRQCGVSPLAEVLSDAPMTGEPVWQPLRAMSSASRQLTSCLRELGLDYKRAGAFGAVFGDNPDRVSQAANSGIELMTRTARTLIQRHPHGTEWLSELAASRGHEPAKDLFRGSMAVQRGRRLDGFEDTCHADLVANDCVVAALRVRDALERLKHGDRRDGAGFERLCRCLVATEAVMILLVGIVQLRVDDPAVGNDLAGFDLEQLESYSARTQTPFSTRAVLTYAALKSDDGHPDPTGAVA